jgi:uncharacterized protein YlaI
MKVVTDLSKSFNPVPKTGQNNKKSTAETGRKTDVVKPKIKQKSKKLAKLEKDRFSILQKNDKKCFICKRQLKLDKHEALGGSNRQKSMQWGLVYYLCRECHSKADLDKNTKQYLHDFAREIFIKNYSEELFLKEFKKMYRRK